MGLPFLYAMTERSKGLRRRAASFGAVLVAVTVVVLYLFAPPASAEQIRVGTDAEAWYAILPTCTTAGLCVPPGTVPAVVPPSVPLPEGLATPAVPVPGGMLHVARVLGTDVARAYVKLDLTSLLSGAVPTGGTLTLPFSADPSAGTVGPEMAHIQACFMVVSFPPGTTGSIEEPPGADCSTAATATLLTLPEGSAFVVDLSAFAQRWASGEANQGIALMPAPPEAVPAPLPAPVPPVPAPSTETWQVAFNGRDSAAPAKISATVDYVLPADEFPAAPIPPQVIPGVPGYYLPGAQPPVVAPPQAAPPLQAPTVLVATRGFEYAAVFVLPLVALALGSAVSYSLTREIEA